MRNGQGNETEKEGGTGFHWLGRMVERMAAEKWTEPGTGKFIPTA